MIALERRISRPTLIRLAAALATSAAVTLAATAQQSPGNCRVLEGFSMQPDRKLAEQLAVAMRNGMLLTAEPGITSVKHQDVECNEAPGVWRCAARVEVCRPAGGTTATAVPPDAAAAKSAPTAKVIPKSATLAPPRPKPEPTPVILSDGR